MQYDLDSPEFLAKSVPHFEQMRRSDPIFWSVESRYWISDALCGHCLTDPERATCPRTG